MMRVRLTKDCAEGKAKDVLDVRDGHAKGLVGANLAVYIVDSSVVLKELLDASKESADAGPEEASGEAEAGVRPPVETVPLESAEAATDPG